VSGTQATQALRYDPDQNLPDGGPTGAAVAQDAARNWRERSCECGRGIPRPARR